MKEKNIIIALFSIVGLAIIYFWYKSPVSTVYKDVYWKLGDVLYEDILVETFRNGDIIASIGGSPAETSEGNFTQLIWVETSKTWTPLFY